MAATPFAQVLYHPGDPGLVMPTAVRLNAPRYTDEAWNQGIEGLVTLQAVIHADGTIADIKVTKSALDDKYGLDEKAIDALAHSAFKLAQKTAESRWKFRWT